jgi:hypothetical protein
VEKAAANSSVYATADQDENSSSIKSEEKCLHCSQENHHAFNHNNFRNPTLDERWDYINLNRVCFSCVTTQQRFLIVENKQTRAEVDTATMHETSRRDTEPLWSKDDVFFHQNISAALLRLYSTDGRLQKVPVPAAEYYSTNHGLNGFMIYYNSMS